MNGLFYAITKLQTRLSSAGIDSIVIGGIAVAIWGEPRVTRDVDLKVLLPREEASRLFEALVGDYTPLAADPIQTLRKQGMLFYQDQENTRIDLLLADTPFDVQAIQRGRDIVVAPGATIHVCSPEDLIIYKLISTRARDHEDVQGVTHRQGDALDGAYILGWLRQFEQALDDSTLVAEFRGMWNIT